MNKKITALLFVLFLLVVLSACGNSDSPASDSPVSGYTQISSEEATNMMDESSDFIILDVRTPEEFQSGHIKDAINIPNEDIGTDEIAELPDKDQLIFVYCRSGNRSKQAAGKLADLGYTNIIEFGGIIDWTGEIVTD